MLSISEFADKIIKVRKIIDSVNVSGINNMRMLSGADSLCEEILEGIKQAVDEINEQNEQKKEINTDEVGDD